MILDQVPEEGVYIFYEPDKETYDWTHMNRFSVRRRLLDDIREHQGHRADNGPHDYYTDILQLWVAPRLTNGINWSNCDALEAEMPYDIWTRLNMNDPDEVGGFMEHSQFFAHCKYLRDWLESDPVIEGKHMSRRLGEDLVGDWRGKQAKSQADLEARAEDPPFTAGLAKGYIQQLKTQAKEGNCHMTVWGRAGTPKANKSYRICAEQDSVWNKSRGAYVDRIYLRWDSSYGNKTSAANIIELLCSVVSAKTTINSWEAGGDIWVL